MDSVLDTECHDQEEFCELNPNCEVNLVHEKCPKFCGRCETIENREGKFFGVLNL